MPTAGALKPPPKFVNNEFAWAYTLYKLGQKEMLDEDGNPTNYGAAVAIYKRVVAKYGDEPPAIDSLTGDPMTGYANPDAKRAQLVEADSGSWVMSRGMLWSADEHAHQMLAPKDAEVVKTTGGALRIVPAFQLTRVRDGCTEHIGITPDAACWLVRESRAGTITVRSHIETLLGDLDDIIGDVAAQDAHGDQRIVFGDDGQPAWRRDELHPDTILDALRDRRSELEEALAAN